MRLYHGSPKVLKVLKPVKAVGRNEFENRKAVFLTKTFLHSALYAIGKTLKGRTPFAVSERALIIAGEFKPDSGYVYEVEVENPIKGPKGQYASEVGLKPVKKSKVTPQDYHDFIIRVRTKEEIIGWLNKHT